MLIVELDGSQHSEAEIVKSDEISTHYLEALGYKVLRIWNNQVGHNLQTVVDGIFLMAHSRRKSPSSALRAPSPQGEKGKNDKNKRFEEKS